MKIRKFNLGLSLVTISVLIFDFVITKELTIERGYLDIFVFFLALNIFRLLRSNNEKHLVAGLIINFVLLGFLVHGIFMLLILSFGIGFTGRSFPSIMIASWLLNLILMIVLGIESNFLSKKLGIFDN